MDENKTDKTEVAKVRMNFWMPKRMFTFLEDASSRDGRSMSDVVREAVRDYISKYKDRSPEDSSSGS